MKIHALMTGTVRVKHAFLHARSGPRRQLDLFLPGPWSGPLPIHCWAIQHGGRLLLVDTGESASANDIPFARFQVARAQSYRGPWRRPGCRWRTSPRSCSPTTTATMSTGCRT